MNANRRAPRVLAAVVVAGAALAATALPRARAAEREPVDRWFAHDKALHFGGSALLAAGGYAAAYVATERPSLRLTIGASTAVTIGVGKEILDHYTGGQPSGRDLAWDVLGTATGLGIAWLVERLLR